MAEKFAQADLIVCRSGAITVAEVSASGRAAIFIPFGASTDAHQTKNAKAMQSAGAARLIPQEELTAEHYDKKFFPSWTSPGELRMEKTMRVRLRRAVRISIHIVNVIEGVARA